MLINKILYSKCLCIVITLIYYYITIIIYPHIIIAELSYNNQHLSIIFIELLYTIIMFTFICTHPTQKE